MHMYSILYFILLLFFISCAECGVFGRIQQQAGSQNGAQYVRSGNSEAGASQFSKFNYNNNNRRAAYMNQDDQDSNGISDSSMGKARTGSGLSAWGLITIIMLIIIIGMGGYYGIICYPLICKEERNYDIIDAASTTASANTPTRSGDFEKSGNYSSRSTTPSVIISP